MKRWICIFLLVPFLFLTACDSTAETPETRKEDSFHIPEEQESQITAFDLANTYFTWAYAGQPEEFFVDFESEVTVEADGQKCYSFIARTQDEILCYAAVPYSAQELFIRYTPEAEWERIPREIWDLIDQTA